MRLSPLFVAGLCVTAGAVRASSCTVQQLHWARTSAAGGIIVGASFGTVRSFDHGKTWQDAGAADVRSPSPKAAGNRAYTVFAGDDGSMAYVTLDKLWVRFARSAGWTVIDGKAVTPLPWMMCHKAAS